jgi:hypothetical protein
LDSDKCPASGFNIPFDSDFNKEIASSNFESLHLIEWYNKKYLAVRKSQGSLVDGFKLMGNGIISSGEFNFPENNFSLTDKTSFFA